MRNRSLVVIALGLVAATACTQKVSPLKDGVPPLKDGKEKASYALGMNFGRQLRERSVQVDQDLVKRGLTDGLAGTNMALTDEEMRSLLAGMQREYNARRAALNAAPMGDGTQRPATGQADPAGLSVVFKLAPRLARGFYGGERWVSPATFKKVGKGKTCTVEARVQSRTSGTGGGATWTAADPEMVVVTPGAGSDVKLLVTRPGESRVRVEQDGASRELNVKAAYQNSALQVAITSR
jgi:FKBP-type peptidyl-prolyl isomerase-like protein